jgi:hypothetical protein
VFILEGEAMSDEKASGSNHMQNKNIVLRFVIFR